MLSLKELILKNLTAIYPKEMSSGDIELFSRENGYNGETGRKRVGDLVKSGLVKTRVEVIVKTNGKPVEVAFHQAVMDEPQLEDMPEYELFRGQIKLI